jgi:hypothetical protein
MDHAGGDDHRAAQGVPDEHYGRGTAMLPRGDPSEDIQYTLVEDVGGTVAQP